MAVPTVTSVNVKQAVPFFGVTNMESSLRFYVDGLGFTMKNYWVPDREEDHPDGRIRWCWLELGESAIMLQEFRSGDRPREALGSGVNICFQCASSTHLTKVTALRQRSVRVRLPCTA
jgi:lactoylglutathione lyase